MDWPELAQKRHQSHEYNNEPLDCMKELQIS